MKTQVYLFIFLTFSPLLRAQESDCSVVLNHFLIFVDSTTYNEILESEVFNTKFAYSYERDKNWEGIYIIGEENYIEIFNPNSIPGEEYPAGTTWICHSSLKANCIKDYSLPNHKVSFTEGNDYDEVSFILPDSSALFTTWEMKEKQYESWVKKPYSDTLNFKPTDYNSPAESDSSKNYLFNSVRGIEVLANRKDSVEIGDYFTMIGYEIVIDENDFLMYSNGTDYVELVYSNDIEISTITKIYFELDEVSKERDIIIGDSRIQLIGTTGIWELNRSLNNYSTRSKLLSK